MVFTEILKLSAISLLLIPLSTSLKTSISLAVSRSLRVEVIVNGFLFPENNRMLTVRTWNWTVFGRQVIVIDQTILPLVTGILFQQAGNFRCRDMLVSVLLCSRIGILNGVISIGNQNSLRNLIDRVTDGLIEEGLLVPPNDFTMAILRNRLMIDTALRSLDVKGPSSKSRPKLRVPITSSPLTMGDCMAKSMDAAPTNIVNGVMLPTLQPQQDLGLVGNPLSGNPVSQGV